MRKTKAVNIILGVITLGVLFFVSYSWAHSVREQRINSYENTLQELHQSVKDLRRILDDCTIQLEQSKIERTKLEEQLTKIISEQKMDTQSDDKQCVN